MVERMDCRVCGAADCKPLIEARDYNRHIDDTLFEYYRCGVCQSQLLKNVPSDIGRYYGEDYYPLPDTAAELVARSKYDHYKVDILSRHLSGGRVLEIGPGTGGFAYLAKLAGFDVSVIEIDNRCRRFIAETLDIEVLDSTEMLEGDSVGQYDAILMWHVLEHLPQTATLISNLAAHLKPGGLFIAALPNPDSLQYSLLGKYWVHLDAPRHVNHLPSNALESALDRAEFEIVWKTFSDRGTRYWNRFGWIYSSRNLPAPAPLRALYRLCGWGMACLSMVLGKLDPTRSAYTLVARRSKSC